LRLPQVLSLIVESAEKAIGAKACSLRLLDPMRERLEISAEHGLSESYGRTVQVLDAGKDPRLQYPEEAAREGIVSILAVPVSVKDTVIGVMRVYSAEERTFTAEEVDFLVAIANLGGIAIENARVYEALEAQFEAIRREKVPWAENFAKPRWR
jgi:signal transduction protein with GAF and PtsI domain